MPTTSRAPFTNLEDLIIAMTGDERIEAVLADYCASVVADWQLRCDRDEESLKHYLPPSFSRKTRDGKVLDQSEIETRRRGGEDIADPYQPVSELDSDETTRFKELFALSRRLVVTEDAGAGKSVFTRRAMAWFAEPATWSLMTGGRPALPFRWERNPVWPSTASDYLIALKGAIEPFCAGHLAIVEGVRKPTAAEVVEYALKHDLVVLFCDAFDQLSGPAADAQRLAFQNFVEQLDHPPIDPSVQRQRAEPPKLNRVVVTSRAWAYENRKDCFPLPFWTLCRLDGFPPIRQLEYLADLIDHFQLVPTEKLYVWSAWKNDRKLIQKLYGWRKADDVLFASPILGSTQVFGELYWTIKDLLKAPVILAFVRSLCHSKQSFPKFTNRADLYYQANNRLIQRNLEKRDGLDQEIEHYKAELREILAAIAFQMMVDNAQNYVVQGQDAVQQLQTAVRARLNRDYARPGHDKDWKKLWSLIMHLAGFAGHLVVEDVSQDYFGWKHRGMMEFYCGLFLANNSQSNWPAVDPQSQDRAQNQAALTELLADEHWQWAGRFAIEFCEANHPGARAAVDRTCLQGTFSALFGPPRNHVRPTELMYRAWHLMRKQNFLGRDKILAEYQRQFHEILAGPDLERAKLAAELVPDFHLSELVEQRTIDPSRQNEIAPPHDKSAYVRCPPRSDALTFIMGAAPDERGSNDEKPWHEVQLPAFHMATCCVTRAQYRLFDPHLEMLYAFFFNETSPDDDCPVIQVNWFDGFCMALWVGASLPTETEWEGAAWGESTAKHTLTM